MLMETGCRVGMWVLSSSIRLAEGIYRARLGLCLGRFLHAMLEELPSDFKTSIFAS